MKWNEFDVAYMHRSPPAGDFKNWTLQLFLF